MRVCSARKTARTTTRSVHIRACIYIFTWHAQRTPGASRVNVTPGIILSSVCVCGDLLDLVRDANAPPPCSRWRSIASPSSHKFRHTCTRSARPTHDIRAGAGTPHDVDDVHASRLK